MQQTSVSGRTMEIVRDDGVCEKYDFSTAGEAAQRAAVMTEAFTWLDTPFVNCCDKKGKDGGGVDCAMLLVRCFCDTGVIAPFDPRPYPPNWFQNQSRERFLELLAGKCGAHEIDNPRPGDVIVWRWGKTYAHGSLMINSSEIIHAYAVDGSVMINRLEDDPIKYVAVKGLRFKRPVKYFSIWKD